MIRFAAIVAVGSAWVASLVVVGAYAGWTFAALAGAGLSGANGLNATGSDPALIWRFVGGQITRAPFEIISIASLVISAVMVSLVGGIPAKCIRAEGARALRYWQRGAVIAIGLALLCAIVSIQSGFELRATSLLYWAAVGGNDAAAVLREKELLDAVHGRAQSVYFAMVGLAALSTVLGAIFVARRSSIVSRA